MKAAVEKRPPSSIARLTQLVLEIGASIAKGEHHYREAGRDLIEAKKLVSRGEWHMWLEDNFHLSVSTAKYYMGLARGARPRVVKSESHHTLHRNINRVAGSINFSALRKEHKDKEKERQVMRVLSHKLIDIGYRVLAAKLHPDKPGGSEEGMQRLNTVKNILKGAI